MHERFDALVGDAYEILPFRDLPRPHRLAVAWYMAVDGEAWDEVDFLAGFAPEPQPAQGMPKGAWGRLGDGERRRLQGAWEMRNRAALKARLEQALPAFAERYGDVPVGVAEVPAAAMVASVESDPVFDGQPGDWGVGGALTGHMAEYMAAQGMSAYPETDRWPCILSGSAEETLQDGWHRLRSYLASAHPTIPVVFFPRERHLAAKGVPVRENGRRRTP